MFCRTCGAQLKPESRFCKQCGVQVGGAQAQISPLTPRAPQPPFRASTPSPPSPPAVPEFAASAAATATISSRPLTTVFTEAVTREVRSSPDPAIAPPPAAPLERAPHPPVRGASASAAQPSAGTPPARPPRTEPAPAKVDQAWSAQRREIPSTAVQRKPDSRVMAWILVAVLVAAVAAGGFLLVRNFVVVPDATIAQNVRAKLSADARFRGDIIRVDCVHGDVTLSGFVSSEDEKAAAIQIASGQHGVKQVYAVLARQDQMVAGVIKAMGGNTGQTSPTADTSGGQDAGSQPSSPSPSPENPPAGGSPQPLPASGSHETIVASTNVQSAEQTPAAEPAIVQAVIQLGGTSLQLPPGQMYIYAMATGGARQSSPFVTGQVAQVINGYNNLAAALASGTTSQNQFSTTTYNHAIGGVSVSGQWDSFDAFYGSNARPGASIVAASFQVKENSLVVVIGLAGGQTHVNLQGIPGLQVDGASTDAGGGMPMIIAHATLPPGAYVASETSSGASNQDPAAKADLIGVFVFGSKQ
jgi:hypothetical protein